MVVTELVITVTELVVAELAVTVSELVVAELMVTVTELVVGERMVTVAELMAKVYLVRKGQELQPWFQAKPIVVYLGYSHAHGSQAAKKFPGKHCQRLEKLMFGAGGHSDRAGDGQAGGHGVVVEQVVTLTELVVAELVVTVTELVVAELVVRWPSWGWPTWWSCLQSW
jgi:hypothetical protein